ncbi:MAG: MFS transporter [Clostridia bacterium]|nr:MFS transporter [Clostridia bacterium]
MENNQAQMKLNYKKTIYVGFAFFLICAFWQAYEALVPIMLINKFGLNQTWSGVIMALDNILALFMLPLFGALSDKTRTKLGKRTPYILIGTLCSVVLFVGLSFVDYAQLKNNLNYSGVEVGTQAEAQLLYDSNPTISISDAGEDDAFFDRLFSSKTRKELNDWLTDEGRIANQTEKYQSNMKAFLNGESAVNPLMFYGVFDITATIGEWQEYYNVKNELTALAKGGDADAATAYLNGLDATVYGFFTATDEASYVKIPMKIPSKSLAGAELNDEQKALSATTESISAVGASASLNTAYSEFIATARSGYAWERTVANPYLIVIFIVILLFVLIAMATFRSPAVALMPDVTLKPLRSKANAVINLMGTAGGLIVLALGIAFATTSAENALMNYVPYIACVGGIMLIALAIFMWKVKEPKLVTHMQSEAKQFGIDEQTSDETSNGTATKLTKPQRRSLLFLLASVALWFFAFNAITTKYSVYATNILDKDYNLSLLIAQGAAIAAYLPVGMVATKWGRKKTILGGVLMLTAAFVIGSFFTAETSDLVVYLSFILAGIAWATINVNSFPMVVEMSTGANVGKYTGYYYTASMAAQIVTPILSGIIMDTALGMKILFPYGAFFAAIAFVTMLFVKHGDSEKLSAKVKTNAAKE